MIIEDDADIRSGVKILLESQGYQVEESVDGNQAIAKFDDTYNLLIIDIMMPGLSGIETCKKIREKSVVPILFLTARGADTDKLEGLSAGGDDYLVKPFSYIELIARVKALIRRFSVYNEQIVGREEIEQGEWIEIGNISICPYKNEVLIEGNELVLTETEYKILLLFMKYPNKIFSVENIFESVWEDQYIYSSSNTVMVHIKNLRNKLEQAGKMKGSIKTIWGKGYKFEL